MDVEIIVYNILSYNTAKRRILLLAVLTFFSFNLKSQCTYKVSATVISKNGKPISFATVVSNNSNIGSFTSHDGKFTIRTCAEDTLSISHVAFKRKVLIASQITNGDTLTLVESTNLLPEVTIQSDEYKTVNYSLKGKNHGSFSADIGMTFAVLLNKHPGSSLKEVSFYFNTKIEDSIFQVMIIPYSKKLHEERSVLDTVLFIKQNNFYTKKATVDVSNFDIQIPKEGLLVGLKKVRTPSFINAFQLIDSENYKTWVGTWDKLWYNYSINSLAKKGKLGNCLKIDYKLHVPSEE